MTKIREPAVSGAFYPAAANHLKQMSRHYLNDAPIGEKFPKLLLLLMQNIFILSTLQQWLMLACNQQSKKLQYKKLDGDVACGCVAMSGLPVVGICQKKGLKTIDLGARI